MHVNIGTFLMKGQLSLLAEVVFLTSGSSLKPVLDANSSLSHVMKGTIEHGHLHQCLYMISFITLHSPGTT